MVRASNGNYYYCRYVLCCRGRMIKNMGFSKPFPDEQLQRRGQSKKRAFHYPKYDVQAKRDFDQYKKDGYRYAN